MKLLLNSSNQWVDFERGLSSISEVCSNSICFIISHCHTTYNSGMRLVWKWLWLHLDRTPPACSTVNASLITSSQRSNWLWSVERFFFWHPQRIGRAWSGSADRFSTDQSGRRHSMGLSGSPIASQNSLSRLRYLRWVFRPMFQRGCVRTRMQRMRPICWCTHADYTGTCCVRSAFLLFLCSFLHVSMCE